MMCSELLNVKTGSLQRLKPIDAVDAFVVAEATTYKALFVYETVQPEKPLYIGA